MEKVKIRKVKWGEIYECDLGNMKGSVQCGRRPVLVVQTNRLNSASPTIVVAVITSVLKNENMNSHILLGTEYGLKTQSMAMLEQLRTIDKLEELGAYIGKVDNDDKIDEIRRALKFTVGIPMKPKAERKGIILSLCPRCREEFMSVPENIVRRLDPLQVERDTCDKCQLRYGYDYLIMKKQNHKEARRDK